MQGRYAIRHRPFFISCIPVKEIKKMEIERRAESSRPTEYGSLSSDILYNANKTAE